MVAKFTVQISERQLSKFQVLCYLTICDRDYITVIRPQIWNRQFARGLGNLF